MFCDIVFPDGNEQEFLEMARKLGYQAIALAYRENFKKTDSDLKIYYAAVAGENYRTRPKCDILMLEGGERAIIERLNPDLIYGLEQQQKTDHLHQRRSGLNHITAQICAKKNISVGFSLSSLLDERSRAWIAGRMKQNIMLCRKYKVHMTIASFAKTPYDMRAPHDLISLFTALGMHRSEAGDGLKLHETN